MKRVRYSHIEAFCRREFVDKVKGFGEADAFPSDDAEARWIWPEFTRPFGFPAGGQPLCQGVSSDEPHRPRDLPRGLSHHPGNRTDSI